MKIEYLKDGNVITLSSARRERKFGAIAQVDGYWEALRNGRLMPARSEVDPRGIGDQLSFAFILEQIAPGLARIRLAGQHLSDVLAMEVRGMPITAFFLPEARLEMQKALESVFDTPAKVVLSLRGEAGMFKGPLDAQMVLLPLKNEEGQVTRALGALQVQGKLGRGPHRFAIRSMESDPLLTDNSIDAAARLGKTPGAVPMPTSYEKAQRAFDAVTRVDLRAGGQDTSTQAGHTIRPAHSRLETATGFAEPKDAFKPAAPARKQDKQPVSKGHLWLVQND